MNPPNVGRRPHHRGLGARAALQRANLGLAVTAKCQKLEERAQNEASFRHCSAEAFQLQMVLFCTA